MGCRCGGQCLYYSLYNGEQCNHPNHARGLRVPKPRDGYCIYGRARL